MSPSKLPGMEGCFRARRVRLWFRGDERRKLRAAANVLEALGHELEVVFKRQFGDQIGEDVLSALYEAIEVR